MPDEVKEKKEEKQEQPRVIVVDKLPEQPVRNLLDEKTKETIVLQTRDEALTEIREDIKTILKTLTS